MKRTEEEVRAYYRDESRARGYVGDRFRVPLGALLHDRQVSHVIKTLRGARASSVLEIAGGPARLTREIAEPDEWTGTMIDASIPMLSVAQSRLRGTGSNPWRLVNGNAFQLPFRLEFDCVYSFRFIRHFEGLDRQRIYSEIRRILKPGGILVFDAVNWVVSGPLREKNAPDYPVYDALLDPQVIRRELSESGFERCDFVGIQRRYSVLYQIQVLLAPRTPRLARILMEVVDRFGGGQPLEWIVTCRSV